jgi:hypothetical protein
MADPKVLPAPGTTLAIIHTYDDLVRELVRRKETLGFSYDELDEHVGVARAYANRVLGRRKGNLGPLSLGLFLAGLGLKLAVVVDHNPTPAYPRNDAQARPKWRPDQCVPQVAAAVAQT